MIIGNKTHIGSRRKVHKGTRLNQKPWIATLTSTGTGVSTLSVWVTKDITLTLDGTARFYDDAAGTTNEGTSRTVVAGAMRTFYIKCTPGTASLVFSDVRNLVRWGDDTTEGWVSSTTSSIGGSIESLTSLTHLYIYDSNTLSGDITGLTSLTFLYVEGNNTLSGDIGVNNMVSGLTAFGLAGNNQMDTYTAGAVWGDADVMINPAVGYGYDSTEIDNILIDMANSAGGPSGKTIMLQGSSQPRTSASDAAVATLQGRGCTIITN